MSVFSRQFETVVTCNPETNALFAQLDQDIAECFLVPNSKIGADFQDKRGDFTSLKSVESKATRAVKRESKYRALKNEKTKRVAELRAQWEANPDQPLQYRENERMLNNKMIAFCSAAVKSGFMSFEDEDE
jgi:hypothetical protein